MCCSLVELPRELQERVLGWLVASREYGDLAEPKAVAMAGLTCWGLTAAVAATGRGHAARIMGSDINAANWIQVLTNCRYLEWTELDQGTGRLDTQGAFFWVDVYEWRSLFAEGGVFASIPLTRRRTTDVDVFEARAGFLPPGATYAEEPHGGAFPRCASGIRRRAPNGSSSFGLALADVVVQIKVASRDAPPRLLYEWSWPRDLEDIPDYWSPGHPVFRRLTLGANPGFIEGTSRWIEDYRSGVDCADAACADAVNFGIRLCHPHAPSRVAQISLYFEVPVALWDYVTRSLRVAPRQPKPKARTRIKLSSCGRRRKRTTTRQCIVAPFNPRSKLAKLLDKQHAKSTFCSIFDEVLAAQHRPLRTPTPTNVAFSELTRQ